MQAYYPRPLAQLSRALCLLCLALSPNLSTASDSATQGTPAIAPRGQAGSPENNDNSKPPAGCSRSEWLTGKCPGQPSTNPPHPSRPYPDRDPYRRPVIIQSTPAPVDDTPLTDDWEGCRKAKMNQLNMVQSGDTARARQLEEWLWKNCRSYSEDLRQLEQDRM